MKYLFITSAVIALFSSVLVAAEVNEPLGKIKSTETKLHSVQDSNVVEPDKEVILIQEKPNDSKDYVITAFTFLLAALTVMATLFGIFIGYIGYKSSKEYEREVARAEKAAERAEEAAKEVEATIHEIRQKGHEAIVDMQAKFSRTAEDISSKIKPEKGATSEKIDKRLKLLDKIYGMYQAKNYEGTINLIEAVLLFDDSNVHLWHLFAIVLSTQKKFQEALEKITIAIAKDPNQGFFYDSRSFIKICWWHEFKGPKPSKSEIIKDISKAIELGFNPENSTKEELVYFLDDSEYEKLIGKTKEEDGFEKD